MDLGFSLFFSILGYKRYSSNATKVTLVIPSNPSSQWLQTTENIIIHSTSQAIFFCIRLHFVCQSHQPDLLGRSLSALEGLVYIHSRTRLFTTLHISPKKNFSFCVYFHILEPISTIHSHDSYLCHTIWS